MKLVQILCGLLLVCAIFAVVPAQTAAALSAQAEAAYQRKEYEKSAQLYLAAIERGAQDPNVFYNAASSLALAGKKDEAFKLLEGAAAQGFSNIEHLKKDSDLHSLHGDARWQSVVEKIAANHKAGEKFWNNPALNTPYRENISDDEKVAGLSKFWSEVRYSFANFDLVPDLDWDALYLMYLPKVRETKTTLEYYRVLMEMCARLKDGHTGVNVPNALAEEVYARPLVRTRLIADRVIVVHLYDEVLRQQGIEKGQEVMEVDGRPVKQYAEQRVMPYLSASTRQDLETRVYDYSLLAGSQKVSVELTLKDSRGQVFKRTVPRVTTAERRKIVAAGVPPMEFRLLPGNIAYVALNSFDDNRAAEMFEAAFAEISRADGLIIDVRENGGGNSSVGYRVLSTLTDRPFKDSKWRTRNYRPSYRAWGYPEGRYTEEASDRPANGAKFYSRPVIVLTSPRTYSAAEDFAVAFDYMKRGRIIGEPTGGSTGQPLSFNLPGGGRARVCTKRDTYPDGREFVGVGVQPQKLVRPTIEDFRAGRDTVLQAALEEMRKMMK
jgi:C-terminal processing protease CtpA/Prc